MSKIDIEQLADKEAQMYAHCVMETELDRDWQYANIDYTNGFIHGYQKATEAQKQLAKCNCGMCEDDLMEQKQPAMSLEELLNKHNIDAGSRGKEKLVAFAQEYANQFREAHNPNNDRINNYARHQFNRSALGLTLVPFEEWSAEAP